MSGVENPRLSFRMYIRWQRREGPSGCDRGATITPTVDTRETKEGRAFKRKKKRKTDTSISLCSVREKLCIYKYTSHTHQFIGRKAEVCQVRHRGRYRSYTHRSSIISLYSCRAKGIPCKHVSLLKKKKIYTIYGYIFIFVDDGADNSGPFF